MILAINTETFLGINYDEAVSIIKSLGGNVKMLVTSPREEENIKTGCGPESKPALQPRREEPSGAGPVKTSPAANKTKTSEQNTSQGQSKSETKTEEKPKIKEDDCKVELVKDSSGIGLSIVGGTDTPMVILHSLLRNLIKIDKLIPDWCLYPRDLSWRSSRQKWKVENKRQNHETE